MSPEEECQHDQPGQEIGQDQGPPGQDFEEPLGEDRDRPHAKTSKQQNSMTTTKSRRVSRSAAARRPAVTSPKATKAVQWSAVYSSTSRAVVCSAAGSLSPSNKVAPSRAGVRKGCPIDTSMQRHQTATATAPIVPPITPSTIVCLRMESSPLRVTPATADASTCANAQIGR